MSTLTHCRVRDPTRHERPPNNGHSVLLRELGRDSDDDARISERRFVCMKDVTVVKDVTDVTDVERVSASCIGKWRA